MHHCCKRLCLTGKMCGPRDWEDVWSKRLAGHGAQEPAHALLCLPHTSKQVLGPGPVIQALPAPYCHLLCETDAPWSSRPSDQPAAGRCPGDGGACLQDAKCMEYKRCMTRVFSTKPASSPCMYLTPRPSMSRLAAHASPYVGPLRSRASQTWSNCCALPTSITHCWPAPQV